FSYRQATPLSEPVQWPSSFDLLEESPVGDIDPDRSPAGQARRERIIAMLDFIFVACTVLFFLVALGYVWACDKLK
ncbi:MAG TPA: hypothetical protein VK757_06585, partial [Candidatus Acidoferrum sp.]|nr:hypothetical protein [Candidatus Acidoferrum sp.]